jgi:hypothetical protein
MEIDHVYLGPASLITRCFEVCQSPYLVGTADFTVGEVSICWVADSSIGKLRWDRRRYPHKRKRQQHRLHAVYSTFEVRDEHRALLVWPPHRKVADEEYAYAWAEKIAQKIEEIYHAGGERRIELLKEICEQTHLDYNVSSVIPWAMDTLSHLLSKSQLISYYKQLLLTPRPICNEISLDVALWGLSREWRCSKERIALFHRWMTAEFRQYKHVIDRPEDYESALVHNSSLEYLYPGDSHVGADPTPDFPFECYLDVMIAGLLSDRRSDEFKKKLVEVLPLYGPEDPASIDAGFAYLLTQLQKGTPERREAAARLLRCFSPLTKKQRGELQALLDDPSMKSLAALVRQGLDDTDRFWALVSAPKKTPHFELGHMSDSQLVRVMQERLRPAPAIDPDRARQLISDLDDNAFRRRENASRQLAAMGLAVEPLLRAEFSRTDSVEVRRRLAVLLTQYRTERLVTSRAIPWLTAGANPPGSCALLQKLASGDPHVSITQEAIKALDRPNYPHGK